jgi:hypothetical protein
MKSLTHRRPLSESKNIQHQDQWDQVHRRICGKGGHRLRESIAIRRPQAFWILRDKIPQGQSPAQPSHHRREIGLNQGGQDNEEHRQGDWNPAALT